MEKNENGYPITRGLGPRNENGQGMGNGSSVGGATGGNGCGNGCGCGNGNGNGNGNGGIVGGVTDGGGCGGSGCVDAFPLAYVYAPNQNFRLLYSAEEALKHGTLFEELYKPKEVYGHE